LADRFYITTAIDYVNATPHIGHAYEKVLADVLARYHRLAGEEVFFLTGTDEHGQNIANAAARAGQPVQAFVEENAAAFRKLCRDLNLSNDDFIRRSGGGCRPRATCTRSSTGPCTACSAKPS
jgi:methionyl-tRNA synthetase